MTVIFPIGGLLVFFGVCIIFMFLAIREVIFANQNIILNFANTHTDIVLLFFILMSACVVLILISIFKDEEYELPFDKKTPYIIQSVLAFFPVFLGLSASYAYFVDWLNQGMEGFGEVFLMHLLFPFPLMIIYSLFVVVLNLAPLLLLLTIPDAAKHTDSSHNGFIRVCYFIYPYLLYVLLSAGYILWACKTPLWSYFIHSI